MLATVTHILPIAKIRRERLLPTKGTVLARGGQSVNATDVIAEAYVKADYITLDIARALGIGPEDVADSLLREIGDQIDAGSLIAKGGGLSPRQLRAPANGRLVAVSGGQALLEIGHKPFKLQAGLSGVVAEVIADEGCIIETTGAWVQGVWGNGRVDTGPMRVYAESADEPLGPGKFSSDHTGDVILAGKCTDRAALEAGSKVGIAGLIVGSISTRLRPVASKMPYPIVVLDGFGDLPMNTAAYTLLSTNKERETVVNAEVYDRYKGTRPEVVIPLGNVGNPILPMDLSSFEIGQKVRVIKAPHAAGVATISGLPGKFVRFPSGLRAAGAEIQFEDGEKTLVPLANIEVIG